MYIKTAHKGNFQIRLYQSNSDTVSIILRLRNQGLLGMEEDYSGLVCSER